MEREFFFGIDGGGTHSRIQLVDAQGVPHYFGVGKTTNIYATESTQALLHTRSLFAEAMKSLKIHPCEIKGGCMGSAGLDRKREKELFLQLFREELKIHAPLYLCNDGEILLVGGIDALEGISLVAGTGSLAIGRLASGRVERSGGFGYMLGDEGSAYWIVWQALCRGLKSKEHRDLPSTVLQELTKAFSLESADDIIPLMHNRFQKADIAAKAPIVTACALNGDPLTIDILTRASEELVSLVRNIIGRLPLLATSSLVTTGGVLQRDEVVGPQVKRTLSQEFPKLTLVEAKGSGVDGACNIARSLVQVNK